MRPTEASKMRRLHLTRRLLVGQAVVSLLAGCAGTATVAPPSATAQPSASLVAGADVTEVTGTATCPAADLGNATTDANGVTHYRGGTFVCTMRTDDPRVSGTHTSGEWSIDWWGEADMSSGALVQWGTPRLENAGGAWEGSGSGVYSSDRGDIIAFWYKGTGGYADLGYFELWTGNEPWTIRGLIFPGDPPILASMPPAPTAPPAPTITASPTATPSPAATAIAYGPVSVGAGTFTYSTMDLGTTTPGPRGATRYNGAVATGVETANDPRVSVTFTGAPFTIDLWGTFDAGGAVQWGPGRSENDGGTWECNYSGIRDSRGDTLVGWCRGAGGYAGLGYFELLTNLDPFGLYAPDWTDGSIDNQIFPGNPPMP
jgi:hypothetical protein